MCWIVTRLGDHDKYLGAPCHPCDDGKFHWYPAVISNVYESEPRYEMTWKNPDTYSPVLGCHSNDVCQIEKPVAMLAPPLQLPGYGSRSDALHMNMWVSRVKASASVSESLCVWGGVWKQE